VRTNPATPATADVLDVIRRTAETQPELAARMMSLIETQYRPQLVAVAPPAPIMELSHEAAFAVANGVAVDSARKKKRESFTFKEIARHPRAMVSAKSVHAYSETFGIHPTCLRRWRLASGEIHGAVAL
jgi:hypothetical protein